MKIDPTQLQELIDYGFNQDELCIALECNHYQLRQAAIKHNIEFDFYNCSMQMQDEVRQLKDWPLKKIAARYGIKPTEVIAIRYYNKVIKEEPTLTTQLVHELLTHGQTYKEISDEYGLSVYMVKKIAGKHDIPMPKRKITGQQYEEICDLIRAGERNYIIAELYGLSEPRISSIKREIMEMPDRPYQRVTTEQVKELHNKGLTQEEIAAELNTSQPTISRHLKK